MPYEEVEKLIRAEQLEDLYDVGQELGRGKFAIVKRCKDKRTGRSYAAKFLRKRRGGRTCREAILVEVDIMRQALGHQRIVTLHEVFESTREMIIILELASGGELFRMIAVDPLPEDKAREVVWQLLEGVSHLHNLSIVHLDLKPENILLERKGTWDIKIADFGLALQISPGQRVQTLVGTAEYVAPEILNYEPLSIAADLWSIGALTYALLAGYSPFQGDTHNETFLNVSMCAYDFDDEVFDDVSQEAKDFIEDLLVKDPKSRLPVDKCLSHPWIKARSAPSPQSTQINNEGLNSSTSSLDSALCLDSASSLEPSPCSSASSSFAPRPSKATDDRDADADNMRTPIDFRQVTEKVSTLCTETQKAEVQSSIQKPASANEQAAPVRNLDGSVSSVSSNESSQTVKIEDEIPSSGAQDKEMQPDSSILRVSPTVSASSGEGKRSPVEGKYSPVENQRSRHTSSSSTTDDESGRSSRPGSALRGLTSTSADVTSLSPETVEKLKKFERLKQKLGENKFSSLSLSRRNKSLSEEPPENSSQNGVTKQKLRKTMSHSLSPQPVSNDLGVGKSEAELSKPRSASPPSLGSARKPFLPSAEKKNGIEEKWAKSLNSRSGDSAREVVPVQEKKLTETPTRKTSTEISKVEKSRPTVTMPQVKDLETSAVKPVKTAGSSSIASPTSQAPEHGPIPENLTTKSSQALFGMGSSEPVLTTVPRRQKSSQTRISWRQTPHIDPDDIAALLRGDLTEADLEALEKRRSRLETFTEENPRSVLGTISESQTLDDVPPSASTPPAHKNRGPPGVSSPLSSPLVKSSVPSAMKENNIHTVALNSSPTGSPQRTSPSSSGVIMRIKNSAMSHTRRQMVVSTPVFDENLNFGSPLQSPSGISTAKLSKSSEGGHSKHPRVSNVQSSLTHSISTPDLSAILATSKSAKRHKQKEDSYVMDAGSSRTPATTRRSSHTRTTNASIRTSLLFSGGNIMRSLTISGKNAKRNSSKRPGYKV